MNQEDGEFKIEIHFYNGAVRGIKKNNYLLMYRRSQNIHVQILNKCKCTRINVADVYADGFIRIS